MIERNSNRMQNVIVGTAGHVDHGKTCLIKALSGIDTDRLKEEKKRGITIELGFANLIDTDGVHIGIIDVPGHEKFVKNMLAGIGGIDLVLLVIALDEGVMPQTVEHFEILKMLQIRQGIVVLTKSDTVDSDWADMVEEDVRELIKGSFLEQAELIRVSSYTGENIDVLRQKIVTMAKQAGKRREEKELFRLPIDRVFTMEGFGTVVTGTLIEGMCEAGEEVMVYPGAPVKDSRRSEPRPEGGKGLCRPENGYQPGWNQEGGAEPRRGAGLSRLSGEQHYGGRHAAPFRLYPEEAEKRRQSPFKLRIRPGHRKSNFVRLRRGGGRPGGSGAASV